MTRREQILVRRWGDRHPTRFSLQNWESHDVDAVPSLRRFHLIRMWSPVQTCPHDLVSRALLIPLFRESEIVIHVGLCTQAEDWVV